MFLKSGTAKTPVADMYCLICQSSCVHDLLHAGPLGDDPAYTNTVSIDLQNITTPWLISLRNDSALFLFRLVLTGMPAVPLQPGSSHADQSRSTAAAGAALQATALTFPAVTPNNFNL